MKREEMDALAEAMGGMCILGCLEGSPADMAGLRYGDILLEVNGTPTPHMEAYIAATRDWRQQMALRVFRGGNELQLSLELPVREAAPSAAALVAKVLRSGVLPGIHGLPLPEEEAELLN